MLFLHHTCMLLSVLEKGVLGQRYVLVGHPIIFYGKHKNDRQIVCLFFRFLRKGKIDKIMQRDDKMKTAAAKKWLRTTHQSNSCYIRNQSKFENGPLPRLEN